MNRLMMAVICAVTSFGVFAQNNASVYDVSVSGKTLKGKNSSEIKKTYTANFGTNAKKNGVFWYMDPAITQNENDPTLGDVAGFEGVITYVSGFKTSKGMFNSAYDVLDPADKLEVVKALTFNPATGKTDYNYKSSNKWCQTTKFTVVTPSECYAVETTKRYSAYLVWDDCCSDFCYVCDKNFNTIGTLNILSTKRYNSNVLEKANRIEVVLSNGSFPDRGSIVISTRGSFDVKNGRPSSLAGECVAFVSTPTCVTCCSYDELVKMFNCDDSVVEDNDTCLFNGSVSIKFNKNATAKYNAD